MRSSRIVTESAEEKRILKFEHIVVWGRAGNEDENDEDK